MASKTGRMAPPGYPTRNVSGDIAWERNINYRCVSHHASASSRGRSLHLFFQQMSDLTEVVLSQVVGHHASQSHPY